LRGEDASNVAVTAIPAQNKVTLQILSMWPPFKDLKQTFAVSRRAEQLRLRVQQRVVATAEDSIPRTEMASLESQQEDASRRILWFKPMSWLGKIRHHRRGETWSASLWQTFFASCVGANIPALAELLLSVCGCRKFQLDPLGDHLCTCTTHSGAKKAHYWEVDQLADLFRTTHRVKTQQVARSRGQRCGDIELAGYLANSAGPVPLVLDLHISHERFESSSDPSINGHLHYPNDVDRSLNEAAADKIRKYRADYNNNPPNAFSFMFPLPPLAPSSQVKSKFDNIFAKVAALRIILNIDGVPVASRSHTHPSHSQTSRLLTSSLSLGVPVPHGTQCM
jgi:hypothetical protein